MIGRRELVLWGTAGLLAASLRGALAPPPADQTMRYDFVRDAGQWKIDDIKGSADGRPCPSAACSPLHSNTRASSGGRPRETGRPSRMHYCE
jgi:hypothetical protein